MTRYLVAVVMFVSLAFGIVSLASSTRDTLATRVDTLASSTR